MYQEMDHEGDFGEHGEPKDEKWNDDEGNEKGEDSFTQEGSPEDESYDEECDVQEEVMTFQESWEETNEEASEDQTKVEQARNEERLWQPKDAWMEGRGEWEGAGRKGNWREREVVPGQYFDMNVGFGQTLRKMPRDAWQAARPLSRPPLLTPVSKVRFIQTATDPCSTTEECMSRCRDIQKRFMDLGFADIPYNFLIGGDGIVYHGRGWMKQAERSFAYARLRKTCIDVAYIGKYEENSIPYEMLAAGADLLKYGVKVMKLNPFFQVFSFLEELTPRNFNRSSKPSVT